MGAKMSGAKLLEFETGQDLGKLDFPDLENYLAKRLAVIKTFPDLGRLIELIKPLLRAEHYTEEERAALKKLRQRAYDRRRNPKSPILKSGAAPKPKIQIPRSVIPQSVPTAEKVLSEISPEIGVSMHMNVSEKISVPSTKIDNFRDGALRALSNINGEHFVKTAPKLLAWFIAAALVSFFLWQQSLALYESAGFTNSIYSAAGGILMIIGFAAYHSITRSWLALFFCIYAGAYEGYLMISGTVANEHQIQIQSIQISPELVFLKEKAAKSLDHYHDLKQRFDNPESKVFKNDWFFKTHLNPAWQESLADHKELTVKESALTAVSNSSHITWLKIFYRLGLVFLCMILVHRFFAVWVGRCESRVYGK
jgi:hypothetical protein